MDRALLVEKFNGLNPYQKQAASVLYGPTLVIAGAGSGKTASMTLRIARMIDYGVPPDKILGVTFTRKAANEMTERLEVIIGKEAMKNVWMGTFHSICIRILKKHATYLGYEADEKGYPVFTIFDTADQKELIKKIIEQGGFKDEIKPAVALSFISDCKNRLWDPIYSQFNTPNSLLNEKLNAVYKEYQDELARLGALDFDDIIMKTVELLRDFPDVKNYWSNRFEFILCDEFQDVNFAQLQLLLLISSPKFNLFVIGDDGQAIYAFRGSDISIILGFQQMFPNAQIIFLEDNYRSTVNIVEAGNGLISHNTKQMPKKLRSNKENGEKVKVVRLKNEYIEAAFLASIIKKQHEKGRSYKDFAILYRSNAQSRIIEDLFRHQFIPTEIVGGTSFYQREEIKDIIAYLRVIFNPKDDIALSRILNKPARQIGKATQLSLEEYAYDKKISIFRALQNPEDIPGLTKRTHKPLKAVKAVLDHLIDKSNHLSDATLVKYVLSQTGLMKFYKEREDGEERVENLKEFLLLTEQYKVENPENTFQDYLQEISLISDKPTDQEVDSVKLMTIHASKGLEFPVVFLIGWNEGLFPSFRNDTVEQIEEDRRVGYVAITRAEQELYIIHTQIRKQLDGKEQSYEPSRFINEIPEIYKEEFSLGD